MWEWSSSSSSIHLTSLLSSSTLQAISHKRSASVVDQVYRLVKSFSNVNYSLAGIHLRAVYMCLCVEYPYKRNWSFQLYSPGFTWTNEHFYVSDVRSVESIRRKFCLCSCRRARTSFQRFCLLWFGFDLDFGASEYYRKNLAGSP